jgi:CHAD domain-containing protein
MRRLAWGRAEKALEALRGLDGVDGGTETTIHDARKDLKKLRAVVRQLRDPLGERAYETANRHFRDAGRALSARRDADVKLKTLEALNERFEDLPGDAVKRWREELRRDRDAVGEADIEGAVAKAVAEIEAGRDGILCWQVEGDTWALVEDGLLRTYKRGRREMLRTSNDPDEEGIHQWRKRTKDLWYQLRVLRNAWPEMLGETADQAHELADLLGDHHDLAILREDLVGRSLDGDQAASLRSAIADRQGELAAAASDLGRRLYAEKPKVFQRRIRKYWLAWRGK